MPRRSGRLLPPRPGSGNGHVDDGQRPAGRRPQDQPQTVWDDGTPITADDYVFTWQTKKSADPKKGGCPALVGTFGFDRVESGTVVSPSEARFTSIKGKAFAD